MWLSFILTLIYTSILVFAIGIYISRIYYKSKQEMQELKRDIERCYDISDNNNQDIYKINDKISSLFKYRVALRKTICDNCYHGPSRDYSNELFFDLESANDFVKSSKEWCVPVIIDLKNNMPINDDHNMKNWDKYVDTKLR